jgi:hypothetical protein
MEAPRMMAQPRLHAAIAPGGWLAEAWADPIARF